MSGNLTSKIENSLNHTKHMQIASPPFRYEPDKGEINYQFIFSLIEKLKYNGYIGCEYNPSTNTSDSFNWAKKYLK